MKFKVLESLSMDEVFFTDKNLKKHYDKHVISDNDGRLKMPMMSSEEYNSLADELSSSPAGRLDDRNSRIIGYIANNGKTVKYDRLTNYMVAYVDDDVKGHEAISFYKQPIKKFFNKVNNEKGPFGFKSHIK